MLKKYTTGTGLLVLIALVFIAGAGTAYAGIVLPTITLGGNVEVIGNMNVNGNLMTDEYHYSPEQTRSVLIAPAELIADSNTLLDVSGNGESAFIVSGSTNNQVFASIPNLPDGSTITELECRQLDTHSSASSSCILRRADFLGSDDALASVLTTGSSGFQTGNDITISNPVVDRDTYSYYLEWSVSTNTCGIQCGFISAKITFTVPKAD